MPFCSSPSTSTSSLRELCHPHNSLHCSNCSTLENNNSISENEEQQKTHWPSIYLCTGAIFCCYVQFSLFLNSQFAFMKTLNPNITEGFFGLVVGGYSLVQCVVTPLIGIWAHRLQQVRLPLIFCNFCMLLGNGIYFFVEWFPFGWVKWVFLVARLLSGIGPAQTSLIFSYTAAASLDRDRPKAIAYITGGSAVGITVGPAFQLLFTSIGYPGLKSVHLDAFTAIALFALSMNATMHFLLQFLFRESRVGILEKKKMNENCADEMENNSPQTMLDHLPPYDRLAIAACCALRFTQYFIFSNLETIGTSFAMMMFGWEATQVLWYDSFAHIVRGAITLAVYGAYILFDLGQKVNERVVCLCSLLLMLIFHGITFSWPFFGDQVEIFDSNANNSMPHRGCDIHAYNWCHPLSRVNVWVYYIAICLCIGLAFPNMIVTMNTLFSRIVGPRMQSKEQALLELSAGIGRMLGPAMLGNIYSAYGPRPVWAVEAVEISVMCIFWILCWKRLIPLRIVQTTS